MEQIRDGRRNILVHPESTHEDLPLTGLPELPSVASTDPFVPQGMDKPKIYPGDVIVGVRDGEISFAELVYRKVKQGILVVSLDVGTSEVVSDGEFSSRFYKADEIHIYEGLADEGNNWNAAFDESKLERPEMGRPR